MNPSAEPGIQPPRAASPASASSQAPSGKQTEFERVGEQAGSSGLIKEFFDFLSHNKKWWLLPMLLVLLLFGLLVILSGSAAAPFIYTLF